jgi:hypothetical protein
VLAGGGAAAVVLLAAVAVPVAASALRDAPPTLVEATAPPRTPTVAPPATPTPAPSPTAPTSCTVRRLPDPDRTGRSIVTGMDDAGRLILGRNYPRGDHYSMLVWEGAAVRRLDVPGADQSLHDVNSAGVAVGISVQGAETRAWVHDGKATRLRAKSTPTATAIGDSGVIVGSRSVADDPVRTVPIVWRTPDRAATDLPRPGRNWYGWASDVAPDGTIVGALGTGGQEPVRGYLWAPTGELKPLPLPILGGRTALGFKPQAIDGRWISGHAALATAGGSDPTWRAVRYDRRAGTFEWLPDSALRTSDMNAYGWSVGETREDRPALLTDAGLLALPRVRGLTWHMATAVSDNGRVIAGQGFEADGRVQALLWNCR